MAFDRSVIQGPTGTTPAAVAMAALALSAVVALAGREPASAVPAGPSAREAPARAVPGMEIQYLRAVLARARAETEPKLRVQLERWEQAGLAFDEIAARRDLDAATRKRAAGAAVECWNQLFGDCGRVRLQAPDADRSPPIALPHRSQKLIAAIETYRSLVTADADDDHVRMTLLEAQTYRRYDHLEDALPLYRDIVKRHRDGDAEDARFAASMARDCERRLGRRWGHPLELPLLALVSPKLKASPFAVIEGARPGSP